MKILIWGVCILVVAIIQVMAENAGIILGAIPAVILYGGMFWVAQTLCKAWDKKKAAQNPAEEPSEKKEN